MFQMSKPELETLYKASGEDKIQNRVQRPQTATK